MKGSMKRRNKVFVVEQDCQVSAVALFDDVVPGAADRGSRADTDDPAHHPREEKSDELKPPPARRPSTFLPVTSEHSCRKVSCSNDTTMVDEFELLPWGGTKQTALYVC
jgi:hypothetical protein